MTVAETEAWLEVDGVVLLFMMTRPFIAGLDDGLVESMISDVTRE